jgi:hypothetical protein
MFRRDPVRTQKVRIAVRYLMERNQLGHGSQARLAVYFRISRQRVHQIVVEERTRHAERTRDRSLDVGSAAEAQSAG